MSQRLTSVLATASLSAGVSGKVPEERRQPLTKRRSLDAFIAIPFRMTDMTRNRQLTGRVGGITVQAACGDLHVIALWRLLTDAGACMRGTSTTCVRREEFERITISFEPLGRAQADKILSSLKEQKWITHALLHVLAPESEPAPGLEE